MRNTILQGDIRDVAKTLETASVNCIMTSPAYWQLRDYGTAQWVGGDEGCDHSVEKGPPRVVPFSTLTGGQDTTAHKQQYKDTCPKCGAQRIDNQLGLEPTPELYVANLVGVFRELRRVLRDDGTCWLNLGDSYASQGGPEPAQTKWQVDGASNGQNGGRSRTPGTLKPKDLCMIPARVALALQADGWWLRSDIVWSKTNPMPESVTDRPTKSHEYIFLLTKRARYWYDAEAIKEPVVCDRIRGPAEHPDQISTNGNDGLARRPISTTGRNKRSVWSIPTKSYHGAHFAVFPPDLVRPCILAGCPARTCSACGAPWVRVVEKGEVIGTGGSDNAKLATDKTDTSYERRFGHKLIHRETKTLGHRPTCTCQASTVPGVVLDPFFGSGTVSQVALENGRDWLGVELNEDYIELANKRLAAVQQPLFVE